MFLTKDAQLGTTKQHTQTFHRVCTDIIRVQSRGAQRVECVWCFFSLQHGHELIKQAHKRTTTQLSSSCRDGCHICHKHMWIEQGKHRNMMRPSQDTYKQVSCFSCVLLCLECMTNTRHVRRVCWPVLSHVLKSTSKHMVLPNESNAPRAIRISRKRRLCTCTR